MQNPYVSNSKLEEFVDQSGFTPMEMIRSLLFLKEIDKTVNEKNLKLAKGREELIELVKKNGKNTKYYSKEDQQTYENLKSSNASEYQEILSLTDLKFKRIKEIQRIANDHISDLNKITMNEISNESFNTNQIQTTQNLKRRKNKLSFKIELKENQKSIKKKEVYCTCKKPSYGNMIRCDYERCRLQWFHFECVGIVTVPEVWYCSKHCREKSETS